MGTSLPAIHCSKLSRLWKRATAISIYSSITLASHGTYYHDLYLRHPFLFLKVLVIRPVIHPSNSSKVFFGTLVHRMALQKPLKQMSLALTLRRLPSWTCFIRGIFADERLQHQIRTLALFQHHKYWRFHPPGRSESMRTFSLFHILLQSTLQTT